MREYAHKTKVIPFCVYFHADFLVELQTFYADFLQMATWLKPQMIKFEWIKFAFRVNNVFACIPSTESQTFCKGLIVVLFVVLGSFWQTDWT